MAHYQYQEQEDLMADFDLPATKEILNPSTRISESRNVRSISSYKKQVPKPIRPNFLKQTQAHKAGKSSSHISESTSKSEDAKSTKVAGAAETKNVNSCDIWSDDVFDDLSPECFAILFEDVKKLLISTAEMLPEVGWEDVYNSFSVTCAFTDEVVQEVVKYEEELKYLSSAALLFYGGSWTYLAGVFAAADAFGTQQVLEEAWKVGAILCTDDLEEDDVSPAELKKALRDLGLHIALFTAITVSPSWAEICITVAFASKFASHIPVKNALRSTISMPYDGGVLDDYFSIVDDSWFDLLAVITSNILSLTLFGCFPRLITAMYMGFIGSSLALECVMHRLGESDFEMLDRLFGLTEMGQFYIWGIIAASSMWQALSEYTGYFLFLSWIMFLYPVVRVYKMVDADSDEKKDVKVE